MAGGIPFPVEDKESLNKEREKANLFSLSEKEIRRIPDPEKIPEIDEKDQGYIAWRKKVGWV